jgi:hypothetical protein
VRRSLAVVHQHQLLLLLLLCLHQLLLLQLLHLLGLLPLAADGEMRSLVHVGLLHLLSLLQLLLLLPLSHPLHQLKRRVCSLVSVMRSLAVVQLHQ